jgi:hypothetical protein
MDDGALGDGVQVTVEALRRSRSSSGGGQVPLRSR